MHKTLLLLISLLLCLTPVTYAYHDESVEPFRWDRQTTEKLKKSKLPIYVPTVVATSAITRQIGPLFVSQLDVNKDHYLFRISRSRHQKHVNRNNLLPYDELTMSAGTLPVYRKKPFATSDMFEKPEGSFTFRGYHVDYYLDKNILIWEHSNWEYIVWARNPNHAVNIMERVMLCLNHDATPVSNATRGQLVTFETKERVIADAGWSYNKEKLWYILTGQNTPEQLVKVLNSIVKLDTK